MRWIMKKIKSINNIYKEAGNTFDEIFESLIFSYLEKNNDI